MLPRLRKIFPAESATGHPYISKTENLPASAEAEKSNARIRRNFPYML
jgi:hypothetical protein